MAARGEFTMQNLHREMAKRNQMKRKERKRKEEENGKSPESAGFKQFQ